MQHPILKQHPDKTDYSVIPNAEIVFARYGRVPDNSRSFNYSSGFYEEGLSTIPCLKGSDGSLYALMPLDRFLSLAYRFDDLDQIGFFSGIPYAHPGSDGEALLKKFAPLGPQPDGCENRHRKAVEKLAQTDHPARMNWIVYLDEEVDVTLKRVAKRKGSRVVLPVVFESMTGQQLTGTLTMKLGKHANWSLDTVSVGNARSTRHSAPTVENHMIECAWEALLLYYSVYAEHPALTLKQAFDHRGDITTFKPYGQVSPLSVRHVLAWALPLMPRNCQRQHLLDVTGLRSLSLHDLAKGTLPRPGGTLAGMDFQVSVYRELSEWKTQGRGTLTVTVTFEQGKASPATFSWLRTVLDAYVEHWPRCNRNMGLDPDNNPQLIWNLSLDTLPDTFVDYPGHVDLLDETDADSEPEATPATPVETPVETSGCT